MNCSDSQFPRNKAPFNQHDSILGRGDLENSENSERGGRDPHPQPPPPPPRMKTSLFRTCSNKVTLKFQKQFENTRKKGGPRPPRPHP